MKNWGAVPVWILGLVSALTLAAAWFVAWWNHVRNGLGTPALAAIGATLLVALVWIMTRLQRRLNAIAAARPTPWPDYQFARSLRLEASSDEGWRLFLELTRTLDADERPRTVVFEGVTGLRLQQLFLEPLSFYRLHCVQDRRDASRHRVFSSDGETIAFECRSFHDRPADATA